MGKKVLQALAINKSFPGTKALADVTFEIKKGEVVGLIGENGAGKSTLVKIITGVYLADSGEILLDGEKVCFKNSLEALTAGIAIMHQELNLFNNLSVYENIYFERKEYRNKASFINKKQMCENAALLLQSLGADINPNAKVVNLSIREKQIIEIARAVSANAKVIIMDEPSAALTESEVQNLFNIIEKLIAKGVAIIYVSHRMNEIERICNRVTILRDGKNAGELQMNGQNNIQDIVKLMVGREVENFYPHQKEKACETLLKVQNLCCGFVQDVSFEAKANEVLCIYGLAGSGSTELAECIFGLRKKSNGEIYIKEEKYLCASPSNAIKNGVAYVPFDRRGEGIVGDMSVENNLILASFKQEASISFLKRRQITNKALFYKKMFNIKMASPKQKIVFLSGGNQQKVVLSKWLKTKPKVLILNEPTRGVDVGAKAEIYTIIDELAHSGIAVILISSEIPEVLGMCDRVLVMNKGQIVAELASEVCSQETLLKAASAGGQ